VLASFVLSSHPSAGASGAIFGLVGTQAVFFYRYRNAFGRRGRRMFYSTLSIIAFNLVVTFATPRIDIWGHLGGLFAGALLGWGMMPRYAVALTAYGPTLVDDDDPRRWGATALGATVLLAASIWMAIAMQAPGT
jgi:membrane associated rhomboid family serine protease